MKPTDPDSIDEAARRHPLVARYTISQAEVQLSAQRPIRAEHLAVPRDVAPHDHTYHEICLVHRGQAMHRTTAGLAAASRGAVLIVPPGAVHAIEKVRGLEVTNVYYLGEWMLADPGPLWGHARLADLFLSGTLLETRPPRQVRQIRLDAAGTRAVAREFADIADEWVQLRPSPFVLRAALLKAMVRIVRGCGDTWHEGGTARFRPEVWTAIQRIEAAVAEGGLLHAAELAKATGVSSDHLSRVFRRETRRGLNDYFQRRRVHRACHMLLDPRATVTGVAYSLSYSDAAHFCRMFKRYRGMTPREYRRVYLPGEQTETRADEPA